jgi:hypothetical protein
MKRINDYINQLVLLTAFQSVMLNKENDLKNVLCIQRWVETNLFMVSRPGYYRGNSMFFFFFYKNYVSTTKINQLHQTAYLTSSIWQKSVTSNSLLDQQHMTKISYIKQPTWPAAYDTNQLHQTAYLTSSIWQKSSS